LKESRQMHQTRITKLNEMFDRQQLTVYCLVVTSAQRSVPYSNLQKESILFRITIPNLDSKYGDT